MAIAAMRAGKDVDVEKPMALTIDEAREMARVARETKRILAIDSEHMAHGIWEPVKQVVDAGLLGKVLWTQTSRSRNTTEPPFQYAIDEDASPENLDWEAFLGSAPKRPFSKERFFRWRRYRDYSGGIATDLYYHHVTPMIHLLGREFPIRAVSAGGNYLVPKDVMEIPDVLVIALDFPSKHTVVVAGSLQNGTELPIVVRGNQANLHFEGDQRRPRICRVIPEEPHVGEFRERVEAAGLDSLGTWIEESRNIRVVRFSSLPARRKREAISALLAEPHWRERYANDTDENPELATPGAAQDQYIQSLLDERARRSAVKYSLQIEAQPTPTFRQRFLESIRTRKPAPLDGELGYRSQVAVSLGVEAYRRNKAMAFDLHTEQVREL